jgi:hypothetical protein
MDSWKILPLILAVSIFSSDALSAGKARPRRKNTSLRAKEKITVPVNVGIGPTAFMFFGPVADDQLIHPGIRVNVFAALDAAFIKKNINRVPRQYRKQAKNMRGEIRYSPLWWLPESLVLSPKTENTGIFGVNFKPFSLGLALSDAPRLDVSAGLLLSYAYITSTTLPSPTHFLRPGLELKAELEFPIQQDFRISIGWASSLYPPQEVGGDVFKMGDPDVSIWHIGQAFVLLHFRFPYETEI